MAKKKILVWETLATVSGGQKMTLTILDMMADQYDFCGLIPKEGMLSDELKKRNIPYILMGDQTLPTGVKGKQVIFRYAWMSLKNIWKSLGVIRKYKPDMLYCPGPAALPWSAVCGTLVRKPVIWHLHHIFLDGATKKLLNICGKLKSVKKIIAVSNCVGDQIVNEAANKKVKVLYNPVDIKKYANGDSSKILAEMENFLSYEIKRNKVLIITQIGAITKNKCQDVFVRVVEEIKKRGLDVIGLMIGDTVTKSDIEYKKMIDSYIHENGLEHNIYAPGFRSDIADILAVTDCVVVPSSEGLSLVAMEAMSARTHIVCMDGSGSAELLKLAGCGVTYPVNGTVSDIADAVLTAKNESSTAVDAGYEFCLGCSYKKYAEGIRQILAV